MTGAAGLAGVVATVGRRFVSIDGPFDERGMPRRQIEKWKVQTDDEVLQLQVAAQRRQPADFARHDQRLDLPLQAEAPLAVLPFRPTLAHPLDLDLADRVGDPLRRVRLAGAEKDLRRGLRQHRLGVVAVARFELAPSLEAEHDRIVRLPVLGHGGVELRQPLQARELVEDEPDRPMTGLAAVHQPQHEHVEPQARERHETRACLWRAREEQPAATVTRPRLRHSSAWSSPIRAGAASACPPPC